MASSRQKLSTYFVSLKYSERKRYLEKLEINGHELDDPFAIDEDQ